MRNLKTAICCLFIFFFSTACADGDKKNDKVKEPFEEKTHTTIIDTANQPTPQPVPSTVKYGSAWHGYWMNEKYKIQAKEQGDFFHYLRAVILGINEYGVGHNLVESVAYPIDTINHKTDGYLLMDTPPYYLSDYFLDYLDSDRFYKKMKKATLSSIPKDYRVYLQMEKSGEDKYLTVTIYLGAEKKIEKFVPYESMNSVIAGNYIDSKGNRATFSSDGSCNWGVYKSYELALSDEAVIIFLRKFPLQKETSDMMSDTKLVEPFILEYDPNKQMLKLFHIVGSDKFSGDDLDIVCVFGYPSSVIDPVKGDLREKLIQN